MTSAVQAIDDLLSAPLPLADGRAHGTGFVGPDLPLDVFCASGRPFGHLPWRANGQTPWANRWLESSFPGWARSILQQWHDGTFDSLDVVVFSRADDASQRLCYYVKELQRRSRLAGPRAHVFDIAMLPRPASLAHTAAEVLALADVLDIDRSRLRAGIERGNGLRRRLAEIGRRRTAAGPHYERLGRAVLWSDATQWIDSVELPSAAPCQTRVLMAGSVPPDDRMHRAVEQAGASIVAEAHVHSLGRLGDPIAAHDEHPERAIARHLQRASTGPRAGLDRGHWIVEQARAARADAVLIWLTREDEALAWHVPSQRRALDRAGIPVLILHAEPWCGTAETFEKLSELARSVGHAAT